jgi:hypothetical protein
MFDPNPRVGFEYWTLSLRRSIENVDADIFEGRGR